MKNMKHLNYLIIPLSLLMSQVFAQSNTSSFEQSPTSATSSFTTPAPAAPAATQPTSPTPSSATAPQLKLDNSIDVGSPGVKKIRLGLPHFIVTDSAAALSQNEASKFTQRFHEILDFTNWFEFTSLPEMAAHKNPATDGFYAKEWTVNKTEFVVVGKVTPAKMSNRFNLEMRLYDVKMQNMLVGKIYTNLNTSLADVALKRFGDVLVGALTGTPGPFMSKIAFVGKKNDSPSQIYMADFDGKNTIAVTKNHAVNISPAWSPDGTKLTYTSFVSGAPEIYQYNVLTRQVTQMTKGAGNSSGASWSSDSNTIAYSASNDSGHTHIYSMNSFGGEKKLLVDTGDIAVEPAYSPNGKYLAFTSNLYGKPMIFTRNMKTGELTRVTFAGWYNASASWSPDSLELAFASYDRQIDRWDIFKIHADGTHLERLTLKQGDNEKPSISPDGRFIVYQSTRSATQNNAIHGAHKLYVISKDGSFQREISLPIPDAKQPAWGPRLNQLTLGDDE